MHVVSEIDLERMEGGNCGAGQLRKYLREVISTRLTHKTYTASRNIVTINVANLYITYHTIVKDKIKNRYKKGIESCFYSSYFYMPRYLLHDSIDLLGDVSYTKKFILRASPR